jgi:hypothetical protein
MSIRPGQAKGPYVGLDGGAADAFTVMVTGADTTPGYLNVKIVGGTGIDTAVLNAGGDEDLEISLSDSFAVYPEAQMGYYDDFLQSKPFWENMPVITSGDWQVDAVNNYLLGLAQNNLQDAYRYGIEGDFDHSIKIWINTATSCGIWFDGVDSSGTPIAVKYKFGSTNFEIGCTGETPATPAILGTTQWIRLKRVGSTLYFLARLLDTDDWTLIHTYTNIDLGYNVTASFDSATAARIYYVRFVDNIDPVQFKSTASKVVTLTDAATIAVDARRGDVFTVTLGGNRTMGAPTNPTIGQKIIFRVKQSVGGSNTLAWNAIYRFSTDIPSPTITVTASKIDYIGFIYNSVDNKWDCIALVQGF